MLTAAVLGFALGLRHAFDPDHLAAVSSIAARHRNPWTASWLGAGWGLGHAATLLLVGALLIALRVSLPEAISHAAEAGVGAMLVVLGCVNLRASGDPERSQRRRSLRREMTRAGAVGLVHGLAGSGAVAVLATAAMPSPPAALVYLGLFALGSAGAMAAFSGLLGAPIASLGAGSRLRSVLVRGTGALSLALGGLLLARFAGVA